MCKFRRSATGSGASDHHIRLGAESADSCEERGAPYAPNKPTQSAHRLGNMPDFARPHGSKWVPHPAQLEMRHFGRCFQHGGCLLPIGCSGGAPHAAGAPRSARNSPPSHRTKCSNSLFFAPGDAGLVWGLPEAARMHERASLLLVCAQQGGTDACEALTLMLARSTRRERCAPVRSPASSSSTP